MIIETSQVLQRSQHFVGEEPASVLELDQDEQVQPAGDVRYTLTAQRFTIELLVRGELAVEVQGRCSRCGERCTRTIRDSAFTRSYPLSAANELIDLTQDIREAILLALPMNFMCSAACRGLCVRCGMNLNKAHCACGQSRRTPAWDKLNQLELKRK